MLTAEAKRSAVNPAASAQLVIEPYREEHEAAVRAFNERLKASQADPNLVFYERCVPQWLPPSSDARIWNEYFVALQDGVVRGAYALKWQPFRFSDGCVRSIACYHHPLSEGIIDRAYARVGVHLIRDAMTRAPLLYSLGMGGYERPLPKMLVALGWSHTLVPFRFKIVRPFRFLREMQALRPSRSRRLMMDVAALSGAGWIAVRAWHLVRRVTAPVPRALSSVRVPEFSDWVDELWRESVEGHGFTAVRDSAALRRLYPAAAEHLVRLRVSCRGKLVGWAVVGERRQDAKYGALRVGSLVDVWARPGDEPAIVRAAAATLTQMNVDVIQTNQSHPRWSRALAQQGFFPGPSNFILAVSRPLSQLLEPFDENVARMHMTRGDGDGLPDNY